MKQMTEARFKQLLDIAYESGWKNRGMCDVELHASDDPDQQKEIVEEYKAMQPGVVLTLVSQA